MTHEIVAPVGRGDELAAPAPGSHGSGRRPASRVAGEYLSAYRGHTLDAYRRDIRQWFDWCELFDTDPLDATRPHLTAYVSWLTGEKNRKAATVARKIAPVAGFYTYAVDEDVIPKSPVPTDRRRLNVPKVARGESAKLGPDREQATAMVAAAGERGVRDRAILLVLFTTGMRVSELTGADLSDMGDYRARRFVKVTRKGGAEQRLLLVPDAAHAIDCWLAERWSQAELLLPDLPGAGPSGTPLFVDGDGHRMTRWAVLHVVRSCGRAVLGDAAGNQLGPHSCRHTAITQMLEEGRSLRDAQLAAGHASSATTEIYAHDQDRLEKSALAVLDGRFT